MKAPRSQSRRDFNVATAGWFTVLKTASRTVTLRPFGAYRSFANPSSAPDASLETPNQLADQLRVIKIPLIGEIGMIDRGLVRMALIILAACSFTSLILWWIIGFRP
jgi:hypothetical protein